MSKLLFLVAAVLVLPWIASADNIVTNHKILLPADASPTETYAARELQSHLRQIAEI